MRNFYLILPIVLCLASCKSKQEVVLQPLPAEILTINEHYYNDDLDALIEDFKAYPQYRDYAYEVIFMDYDFSRMSYEDIFFLKENNANTPELQEGFKGVLEVYQLDITKQLSQPEDVLIL